MELTLDGLRCDLGTAACAVPGYDAAKLADPEACREGRSLVISIPDTPRNAAATGSARDPHTALRFNASQHRAALTADGAVLLTGYVRLLKASHEGYTLEIREGGARWARNAAQRMFDTLGVEYGINLNPAAICRSWTDDSPVKFFPVHRDEYPQFNNPEDLLPAERMLSVDDYYPFLHVATLMETIFAEAGYRIISRFMASEFFRSLYMSGAYASRDTAATDRRMGFRARRLGSATAEADLHGRVYADPAALAHTVGNIVDTASPLAVDADGEPIADLQNNGGCFGTADGAIRFTPPSEVDTGFEYYLKYTSDHRIRSRTRLTGFDGVYLGTGSDVSFALANRYEDRRGEIAPGRSYRVVVFDHAEGSRYRLTYTRYGVPGTVWTEFAARTSEVATPASGSIAYPVLSVRTDGGWIAFADDWALYDGYVAETGQTTVELRLRTASQNISPESPARFDRIYFSGAEPGMRFTLHKECSLRPRFFAGPGYGSPVTFADVARHRIRQSALPAALGHLFNLRFYTEEASKCVRIEPADDFFGGPEADWTGKTDFAQPVELADIAPEVPECRIWGYLEGDGAVKRFDAAQSAAAGGEAAGPFGEWAFEVDSRAAKEGTRELRSPLFGPTLGSTGHYLNAPSARILQVGDRDDAGQEDGRFTPRIVRFTGMHPLPAGERWGYPWNRDSYPLAAFHAAGDPEEEGFTLCFEDRDGVPGLHRFYDRQLAQESSRQRITLWLRIEPHEFEALFSPGTGAPDIRSVFLLDTGAGIVRTSLLRIADYDPEAPSVRCTFIRLPED